MRFRRRAASARKSTTALGCSFCGKHQRQVKRLIAGPGVYICNECVDLCVEIIARERPHAQDTKTSRDLRPPLPTPTNIKAEPPR